MAINKLFTDDIKEITIRDERGIVAKLFSEPNEDGNLIEMRAGACANLEYKNPSTVTVIHSLEKRDNKSFDLTNTIGAMISDNYKLRFWAEYAQTKLRYERLHKIIIQIEAGTCDFNPDTPLELLKEQAKYMGMYLHTLEVRAEIEKIALERWV